MDHDLTSRSLDLTLGGDAPVEAAGAAISAYGIGVGLAPERATRLQVVIEEILRASRARETLDLERSISLSANFDGQALRVSMADHSLPVEAGEIRHSPVRRLLHLGFVDRISMGFHGATGNFALVEVDVAPRAAIADHDHDAVEDEGTEALTDDLIIRRFEPHDADSLVRCLYRCYGYSYPDSSMYDARHIQAVNRAGLMHSIVAVTPSGELVGHCALVLHHPGDRAAEAGRLIVDPRYRGHHLAERMTVLRREVAEELNLSGTYAKAVTNHTASQKNALKLGAKEVGCYLGIAPSTMHMEGGLPNSEFGRRSQVCYFTPLNVTPTATVSAPRHLHEVLQTAATRLGVERTFSDEQVAPSLATTALQSTSSAEFGFAEVRITAIGADLLEAVIHELTGFQSMKVDYVAVELPACEVTAGWAATSLEHAGFAFSTWLPDHTPAGDTLVLQHIALSAVDVAGISCARCEGEALRDLVIAECARVDRGLYGLA